MIKIINTGYEVSLKQQLTCGVVKIGTMRKKTMSNNCAFHVLFIQQIQLSTLEIWLYKIRTNCLVAVPHNT
jgi:hypothetical protein